MTTGKKTYAVIRAVYNNCHAPEDFERELDFVLSRNVGMVIIEPESLGEITWRWIRTGNWLHKIAVVCGFSALTTAAGSIAWNTFDLSTRVPSAIASRWHTDSQADIILVSVAPQIFRISTAVFSALSATTAGFYALFWQWDPCCKYQVASRLAALPRGFTSVVSCNGTKPSLLSVPGRESPLGTTSSGHSPSNGSSTQNGTTRSRPVIMENRHNPNGPPLRPVVLVHRDDKRRKLLHNTVALTSTLMAGYVLYKWSRSNPV
ncbi:hypothetical protein AHF37_10184 [Paragonimus kellicotti]|nr:hypothetical protein AHF37_10184 [Paragonimus kellicotti]